jgi:hypothetical protein
VRAVAYLKLFQPDQTANRFGQADQLVVIDA